VLVAAPVSDSARATISQELWNKYVSAYVAASVLPFDGAGEATLDDCRRAGADYLVVAPFELRPRLPGMANSAGRVAARTHLVVTNCITGSAVADRYIAFDSDPPSGLPEADYESLAEDTWGHAVPATLAKYPNVFARIAEVTHVTGPFALVNLKASSNVAVGDTLRDVATPERKNRARPILMTVTQVFPKYSQVTFSIVDGEAPSVGDFVEPVPPDARSGPAASRTSASR
jgi:hypothetical protein